MRRLLIVTALCVAPTPLALAGGIDPVALLESAKIAPPDVTTYVHVEQAAAIRSETELRPIARWATMTLGEGQFARSWRRLATAAGVEGGTLFDACFGKRFTFLGRDGDSPDAPDEWVIRTTMAPEHLQQLVELLRLRVRPPIASMAVGELPEDELLLAYRDDVLLIAPIDASGLLRDIAPRIPVIPGDASLADHEAFARAGSLGPGRVAAFIRHDKPMGGWSMIVADTAGGRVTIRHDASFENPPFRRGLTKLTWDAAPLAAFEDHALLAVIEPSDVDGGQVQGFLEAILDEPLLSEALQENLGDHRILAVGEVEGRLEGRGVDLLLPTAAVCMKVVDGEAAERQLDEKLLSLVQRINHLSEGSFLVDVPPRRKLVPGTDRHLDISPAVQQFSGGFPIMETISLNWTVTEAPGGAYCVIATHPQQLRETVAALEQGPGERCRGRWAQGGTANGQRIGVHLRSYGEQAEMLGEVGEEAELEQTLRMLSSLAEGVSRCRWKLCRPSINEMQLEVELQLAPAESSAGE